MLTSPKCLAIYIKKKIAFYIFSNLLDFNVLYQNNFSCKYDFYKKMFKISSVLLTVYSCNQYKYVSLVISPDESRGYIGFRSVAPPPPPP